MKCINHANGTTTIEYTAQEFEERELYRECCEDLLKWYFNHPDDMKRAYNALWTLIRELEGE